MEGWFKAVDANDGHLLWKFKTESGIISQPVTYRGPDGRQYVAVLDGVGGWAGAAVAANLFLRQATTIGANDCDWNSFYFTDGSISLLPSVPIPLSTVAFPPSSGITSRLQKAPICNFVGMEDDYTGTIKSTIQFYSALSMPTPVTFAPHCY